MTKQTFIENLKKLKIEINDRQIHQFEEYMKLLLEWNEKMNLTAITKEEEVWEKHFYDSIVPFENLNGLSLCDVGSGAGFPGIPLKIIYPELSLTIVEPLQKRCRFLETVKSTLGLEKVEIYASRAEDFVKEHRESYDVVSARAVARLSILMELCAPLTRVDGNFIALKGKQGHEEYMEAKNAMKELGLVLEKEDEICVDDAMRINLYFKKIKNTPLKYPRAYGVIKKKPLG